MKIYYEDIIEATPLSVEFAAAFPEEQIDLKNFKGAVTKLRNAGGGYLFSLTGELTFEYSGVCDRCAAQTIITGSGNIQLYALPQREPAPVGSAPYQLSDEEADTYITMPDYIDLHDILRQEAYLMLPAKIVCENCEDFVDIVEEFDDL
ncbi:MAG: DUF177 domain-containing protein [Deferribacteraceae bacterium]|jgi:uncharacterized metal-binding protein YceD (DUF177 family)|nr:DUF177 domain-containing protein [Deferribacteraceae bacterium]